MKLYITEKPKYVKRIIEATGGQWERVTYGQDGKYTLSYSKNKKTEDCIISCQGHMMRLAEPHEYDPSLKSWDFNKLPFYFDEIKIMPKADKETVLNQMSNLLAMSSSVVHVGDIDDEGQLLVDEILRYYKYKKPVQRLWYSNETVEGFKKALANLKPNEYYEAMGWRALARAYADALTGFNLTRAYSTLFGETTHIGRVKCPIINLVYMRDLQNKSHKKVPYYHITADCKMGKVTFKASFIPQADDPVDEKGRVNDKAFADKVVRDIMGGTGGFVDVDKPFVIYSIDKQNIVVSPKLPFDATELQKEAARLLGFSADKTMEIAQKLKDADLISYHRTNTRELSYDNFLEAQATIDVLKEDLYNGFMAKQVSADKKPKAFANQDSDKQFAHHGIIPLPTKADNLSDDEQALYDMIVKRYLALFMPEYRYWRYKVVLKVDGFNYFFVVYFNQVQDLGFMHYFKDEKAKEKDEDNEDEDTAKVTDDFLESLEVGDGGVIVTADNNEKFTKPLPHYTNATLTEDIATAGKYAKGEKLRNFFVEMGKQNGKRMGGLGTSATVHVIVAELFDKGYLVRDGKKIHVSDKGAELMETVDERLRYPDLTAIWQLQNENIKTLDDVMKNSREVFTHLIEPIVTNVEAELYERYPECPSCEAGYLAKKQNISKKTNSPYTIWACNNCGVAYFDDGGKPDLQKQMKKKTND